jgi:hypothetical protein
MLKINLLRAANCRQTNARAERQSVQNELCSRQKLHLHTAEALLTPISNTNVLFTLRRLKTSPTVSDVSSCHKMPCRSTRIADVLEENLRGDVVQSITCFEETDCYHLQDGRFVRNTKDI